MEGKRNKQPQNTFTHNHAIYHVLVAAVHIKYISRMTNGERQCLAAEFLDKNATRL